MQNKSVCSASAAPMLNLYPDSLGGTLKDAARFLGLDALRGAFGSLYVLPSLYNSDLDRGFSVIDYGLCEELATMEDLETLQALGIDLKLDFLLNHASVLCKPFQDIVQNGDASPYRDFFIDWNRFWEGYGEMTPEGYIQPEGKYLADMFFRKPGLPILMVWFPDGRSVPYWNTFYQEVRYPRLDEQDLMGLGNLPYKTAQRLARHINHELNSGKCPEEIVLEGNESLKPAMVELLESRRRYLGQMDLNITSPLVWEYYEDTLCTLAQYGAKLVRLDAFAYASKKPGKRNFMNDPETWELLARVREIADKHQLTLLPEIHASYGEKVYAKLADMGFLGYDFFLPGLVIDAFMRGTGEVLERWAAELRDEGIRTVNMLGCHDGIPLLDLQGILPDAQIQALIDVVVSRGGLVKDLHGQKNVYYQVNATYYSALGEDDRRMLLARAIQLFMPGKPQVWYLDLFAGRNDTEAVRQAGGGAHKEINRTNLTWDSVEEGLQAPVVQDQLKLLSFRNAFDAFGFDAALTMHPAGEGKLHWVWAQGGCVAELRADLRTFCFEVTGTDAQGERVFCFAQ